jgi:hypothetical protein
MGLPAYSPDRYVGNNSTATYSFSFHIYAASHLQVYQVDDDGNVTLLQLTTNYSVAGVGNKNGGSITLVAGNLPTDYKLVIKSSRPYVQEVSLGNETEYYSSVHETAFNKLARMCQQLAEGLARTIRLSEAANADDFDPTLPLELEPGRILKIADDGLGLAQGPTEEELNQAGADADAAAASATAAAASATAAANSAADAANSAADVGAAVTAAEAARDAAIDARDEAIDARDETQDIVDSFDAGYLVLGSFGVNKNSNADLPGVAFDSTQFVQVDGYAYIRRGTTVFTRQEFSLFFINGAWELALGDNRRPPSSTHHGVTLTTHTSTGQVNAAVDNSGAGNANIIIKITRLLA